MIIYLGLLIPVLIVQSLWWMQVSTGGRGRGRQRGNESEEGGGMFYIYLDP